MCNLHEINSYNAQTGGDSLIIILTFIPLIIMLIINLCKDSTFEIECL